MHASSKVKHTVLLSHIVSYEAFLIASSYLHCKWATLEELEKDPRISQKMKRFRNKQAQMKHIFTEPDEDLFNPDYIEVDRVLEIAITTDTETGEEVTHYLVKWCSLSYEESTWELQEDVDPVKIRESGTSLILIQERNGNQLREYQLEGMNWLLFNWYNRKNCILADEMGLGKTIQSITFLYEIFLMGLRGPFLIIAPLSTITNWEREFRTWTEINVIVYHGSQISRQMILQYEMYHRDEQGNIVSGQFKFHGIITTFEMIMADCPELKKWGRWKDILNHGRFKWHLTERDMEVLCRALLVYCVRHYKGDDKIKSFIWDLITPTKDGHNQALQNHSGLSAPVPRGRKGKKLKNQLSPPELKNADWLVHCNPEVVLQDDSYKKHLKQHCNKVLLRVRMLYYLKVEVLGEAANQALEGIPSSKLEVTLPDIDYIEIPTIWWDAEADKSLLIGVHKHGYERYNAMRADPALCFLERVGMPDVTALTVEQSGAETASDAPDR
uniref:Chromodomain-helicase-DNA-binding protein 6-like n=1 Tax=Sinocyclocheilus anshuiensis TaxID=1608454 RepID=A0A671SR52_9TELE